MRKCNTYRYILIHTSIYNAIYITKENTLIKEIQIWHHFPTQIVKIRTTKGAVHPKCAMCNNKHIQPVNSHLISLVWSHHIRPIYNGKALRYCWEECVCLLLGVLQTNSRAQSKSLFWWSLPCWWTRKNWLFSLGVETSGYTTVIWTSEYTVRTRNFTFKTYSSFKWNRIIGTIGRSVTWEQGAGFQTNKATSDWVKSVKNSSQALKC